MKIIKLNYKNFEFYQEEFIKVYKDVFSKYPYYEIFGDEEVKKIYKQGLLESAHFLLAIKEKKLIGFAFGIKLSDYDDEHIKNTIGDYFNLEKTFFNAELGVLAEYRRDGVGSKLIQKRVEYAKKMNFKVLCMKTKKESSMSLSLYKKIGYTILKGVEEVSNTNKNIFFDKEDERIYLYKLL